MNHDLITPYPVLVEKPGEFVAQFKATVAILPRSTTVLAGEIGFKEDRYQTENSIKNEGLKEILASDLWKKEEKKKAGKKEEEKKE